MKKLILLVLIGSPLYAAELGDLTAKLKSEDVEQRRTASDALGSLAEKASAAKPALRRALKDPDVIVRANAAWALGKIGSEDTGTIQSLIAATGDGDWTVRHNAAQSLVKAGNAAIDPLEQVLKTGGEWQRFYAADTLVRIDRKRNEVALPALIAALKSSQVEMQARAAAAVSYLGKDAASATAEVIQLIPHADLKVKSAAIVAAGALGSAAQEGVPVLITVLEKEKDGSIRCAIYSALAAIGEPSELIIQALMKGLEETKDQPQAVATEALAKMGVAAVDPLVKAIQSRKTLVPALDTLTLIGPKAQGAVPTVLKLIDDGNWMVRLRTASALGAFGAVNDQVLDALNKASKDPHETVRAHAVAALARLEKKPSH